MSIGFSKAQVIVDQNAIVKNFRQIATRAKRIMPVIKSNAYGHGLVPTGITLEKEGIRECAVSVVQEGLELRHAGFCGDIVVLLGVTDDAEASAAIENKITPLVFDYAGLERMTKQATAKRPIRIALKFDTGMARLGFEFDDIPMLCNYLQAHPTVTPIMAVSHLAASDEPEQRAFTLQQGVRFRHIMEALRSYFPNIHGSLTNSAGTLAYPELHWDIQRPGLILYGGNPLQGTTLEHLGAGLHPAMSVWVPILQLHTVKAGATVSYGRTFTAPHDMKVAVIPTGYANAYSRRLSGKGHVVIDGHRAPIIGRVCMQMCIVDVSHLPAITQESKAWLLGGPYETSISCDELAAHMNTISYEVLCLLGLNPHQQYSHTI